MIDLQDNFGLFSLIDAFSRDAIFDYQMVKIASDTASLLNQGEDFRGKIKDPELANQFESFLDAYRDFVSLLSFKKENLTEEAFQKSGAAYRTMQDSFNQIIKSQNPYLELNDDFDTGAFSEFLRDVLTDANEKIMLLADGDDISDSKAQEVAEEFNDQARQEDAAIDWSAKKIQRARESQKKSYEELKFLRKVDPNHPRVLAAEESRKRANEKEKELARTNPEEFERRRKERREKGKINSDRYYEKILAGYSLSRRQMRGMLSNLVAKEREFGKLDSLDGQTLEQLRKILGDPKNREADPGLINHPHFKRNVDQAKKIRDVKEKDEGLKGLIVKLQQSIASQKTALKDLLAGVKITGKTPGKIREILQNHKAWEEFKPFVDAVSVAEKEGTLDDVQNAKRTLEIILNRYSEQQSETPAFDFLTTPFYEFRDLVKQIEKNGWDRELQKAPDGTEGQAAQRDAMRMGIEAAIVQGKEVLANYRVGDLIKQLSPMSPGHEDYEVNEKAAKLFGVLGERTAAIIHYLERVLETNDVLWKNAGRLSPRMKILARLILAHKKNQAA